MEKFSYQDLNSFKQIDLFSQDAKKKLVISEEDYNAYFEVIKPFKSSYLMPESIKEALAFLEFAAVDRRESIPENEYITLRFTKGERDPSSYKDILLYPELDFAGFVDKCGILDKTINDWLKEHSLDMIDLKLNRE